MTEQDFAWLAANGIRAVRIPVGYWILGGDSPYVGSIQRLDWAFTMCKKYGIMAVLDIHGLPGSQNGRDHSGQVGKRRWRAGSNRQQGLTQTVALAKRYAASPVLWGVQIMNEPPLGLFQVALRRYYSQCYRQLCAVLPPGVRVIYSDAFTPRLMAGAVQSAGRNPAVMDVHWYHFVGWGWLRPRWYRQVIRHHGRLIRRLMRRRGVIIGEWSGCYSQRIFNKYPVEQHQAMVREHIAWQIAAYAPAQAWFYWNYKAAGPGVWDFKSLIETGVVDLRQ